MSRALLQTSLFLLLAVCISARAEHLPIKTYTSADGLAQNLVLRIVRDSRGYLWFCTAEGLSRFDGYKFTNYTTDSGLPHRSIRDLIETRKGDYWIATADGVVRFNPGATSTPNYGESMFVVYRPNTSQLANNITRLVEDPDGSVWCGTADGLFKIESRDGQVKFQLVDLGMPSRTGDDSYVEDILQDTQGALWIGTRGSGLYRRWPDERVDHYTSKNGLPSDRVNVLLEDRERQLWVGTSAGLRLFMKEAPPNKQEIGRLHQKQFALETAWIEALLQSSDGRLWVAWSGGLSEFIPGRDGKQETFRSYFSAQGLTHQDLTTLAEDSAGNLWIGATGGAMRLARNGFVTYTELGGIASFGIGSIFETLSGELCFVARGPQTKLFLITYDEKELKIVRPNFPLQITYFGWGWNQTGFQDRAGEFWFATGQGLCRFPKVARVEDLANTRPKAVYTKSNGLKDDNIWRIYEDSRGDIWISTASMGWTGVTRWDRATETFYHYTSADGLPANGWQADFREDSSGAVWIAMGNALIRYAAGQFKSFTEADGLPIGPINALHFDLSKRLWIARDTGGLAYIKDLNADHPSIVGYTTANGLSSNQVWAVTSDGFGNVYAYTGRGLDRLDPVTGQVGHYTTADGLVAGSPKAAFHDRGGTLWFGSDLGLSKLIPQLDSPRSPPPIVISGLRVGGDRHPVSELGETEISEIQLGPNDNQIQIDFVGLSFVTGEELRYQFKLEGAETEWSPATDQRTVNYGRLSAGRYQFLVRAVASDGSISPAPARVSFTILPPVWQRWWFLTLAAVVIGLSAYAVYRYRLARLLDIERVRTRIASDLHDDIGSNLSLIAMVSEVANRQARTDAQVAAWLSLIANTSRETVDSMSDIVWAVNPARDRMADLAQRMRRVAEDALTARDIQFRFSAPVRESDIHLGADLRREVFMIFKEGVNNVVRHSDCTKVDLSLRVDNGRLVLKLSDNGKGFDIERSGDGNGLASMRRRAKNLTGNLEINSRPGSGTTLTLSAPLNGRTGFFSKD